jgi:hypothetical protein
MFNLHAAERDLTDRIVRRVAFALAYKFAREETPRFARTLAHAACVEVARRARLIRRGAPHV